MSKVKINKDDKNRILLTEILPYEVPMLFSNDGFYTIVASGGIEYFQEKFRRYGIKKYDIENNKGSYGIPFNFEIKKSIIGGSRTLSVIHPFNQIPFIDFYEKYDSVIQHLCSKSPFSLRQISKVAKYYYTPSLVFEEDSIKDHNKETEPDILDKETRLLKSYFTYKPIDLIYKFYDRNEYLRLEQRFNILVEFDINKCFYNIYTHSISWAVKDKESAKRNSQNTSFENAFDKLMQLANYNETNGIVVGPEVSRIFAEIILQKIDLNVLSYLNEDGLKLGVDYEIRRYVDDYFIFVNDQKNADQILKQYRKELEEYKLYINESKTHIKTTPFITNIAVGKRELKQLLDTLFDEFIVKVNSDVEEGETDIKQIKRIEKIRSPYGVSKNFIKDFQCIVKRNDLTYDILSKDIIRRCKKEVIQLFRNETIDKPANLIENLFLLILEISFYAYSLNINSSATFKLSQIIVLVCKFLDNKDDSLKQNIYSKIFREADFVMTIFQRKLKKNETSIETLNLLVALKKLNNPYIFSEKKIRNLFYLKSEEDFNRLNYFHIITLLYYFDNNTNFIALRNEIEKSIISRYTNEKDPFRKSELTLLFFDSISCPFISIQTKISIIKATKFARESREREEINIISKYKTWFMDWDVDIDLEHVLKKKEWGSSY